MTAHLKLNDLKATEHLSKMHSNAKLNSVVITHATFDCGFTFHSKRLHLRVSCLIESQSYFGPVLINID